MKVAVVEPLGLDNLTIVQRPEPRPGDGEVLVRLRAASLDERARAEREEFLRFQLDELQAADPQPGEDESLREEQKRLRAAGKLHQAARRGEGRERAAGR